MDINKFLEELDSLFANRDFVGVDEFLNSSYKKALAQQDVNAQITILNEMMGYYREGTRFEEAILCAEKSKRIMDDLGLQGTMQYASMLLNIANVYRASEKYQQAMSCYNEVIDIYKRLLDESDYMYATLHNNISLLYQCMGDYKKAVESLKKALAIVVNYEGTRIEEAVTYTNLAAAYLRLKDYKQAKDYVEKAVKIFGVDEIKDYHYSACLNIKAQLQYYLGEYKEAVSTYDEALEELEGTIGTDNDTYKMILEARNEAIKKIAENDASNDKDETCSFDVSRKSEGKIEKFTSSSMMDISYEFYEMYGKPMLEEKFGQYMDRVTVGLAGEGSECFGFEDVFSKDHDCSPGFCMWLDEDLYEEIGGKLNYEYDKLTKQYKGLACITTEEGKWRRGAINTKYYYEKILGDTIDSLNWQDIEEWRLATATNGRIFKEGIGEFVEVRRRLLDYYPKNIWLMRLADSLARAAQSGQYNYGRLMARGEYLSAKLSLAKFVEEVICIVHLINKKYCPYYKWMHKSMKDSKHLPEMYDILRAIADMEDQRDAWKDFQYDGSVNGADQIALTMEIIGRLISDKLNELEITNISNPYLEAQARCIAENLYKDNNEKGNYKMEKKTIAEQTVDELIEDVVKLEWISFDKVQNEGGRADCQDDWNTFSIMRKSQYMTWNRQLLESFILDIAEANEENRNLIEEKYGRMMESTAPEKYNEIKDAFPTLSEKRIAIQEQIIQIQVQWMEEFASQYKYMAQNARSIHSQEDNMYNTSYETYLRGEISTYSDETLKLYAEFVVDIYKRGDNLAKLIMENTARLYGFESLEQAEYYCKD